MKKIAILVILVFAAGSAAFAQDINKTRLGFYGVGGLSFPGGDLPSNYDPAVAGAWGIGANAVIPVADMGGFFASAEYLSSPYKIKNSNVDITVKAKFYNFMAGWRFMNFQGIYADAGLFLAVPSSPWDVKTEIGSDSSTDEADNDYLKNEFGFVFGVGYLAEVSETVDLNLGLQTRIALKGGYDNSDDDVTLKTRDFLAKVGLEFKF